MRHARKLPEKSLHFYKELNRLKRAALYIGFYELLEGCAAIFDRGKKLQLRTKILEHVRDKVLFKDRYFKKSLSYIFQSVHCYRLKEECHILTVQFSFVMRHQNLDPEQY